MIQKLKVIEISSSREKASMYENPLFPCNAYFADWRHGALDGIPWHWHQELELMYVARGQAVTEYGNKRAILKEGEGFFCNSKVLHQIHIGNCEDCRITGLIFDMDLITGGKGTVYDQKYVHPLVSDEGFPGCFLHAEKDGEKAILDHLKEAHEISRREPLGFEYDVRYHLSRALLLLSAANQKADRLSRDVTAQAERAKRMLDYIHAHFSDPITTEQLAAHASISEREVQRCFHSILHMSPMHYLQKYRIQAAGELLLDTESPIWEIAMNCGFSNPSHFSKTFRAWNKCTPQAFRKRNVRFPEAPSLHS